MPASRARPLVLVVDDYDDVRTLAALTLPLVGLDVALAANGLEALGTARRLNPDVVLLDICMPGMDGYATLSRLKEDPATAAIPVVAFTAKADDEALIERAGFAAWCAKPCLPEDLGRLLQRVLAEDSRGSSSSRGA